MPTKTVNLLIIFLGAIVLAVVVGAIVLAQQGDTIPAELVGLGGTALGALVTLLTRPPTDTAGVAAQVIANQPPPVDLSQLEAGAKALLGAVRATSGSTATTTGTSVDAPLV